jgi:RNA polymerase sigma-70 factor (ECF subfamily)
VPDLATEFETHRDHLTAVAYRMLGSRAEAWLRYSAALGDPAERARIRDLRGWLTTTTGRICLDVLRSARVRRETYPGQWLPEPVVTRLPGAPDPATAFAPDPAERASRSDEIGMALLVVLERLSPEQRVAFVLHDVFAVPFEEIAGALGGTPAAARQLASRARRAVADGAPRHTADLAEQRRVLAAFGTATQTGDLTALLAVLAPDVVMIGDGGGLAPTARNPVTGAEKVARFLLGLLRRAAGLPGLRTEPVLVNGALGFLVEAEPDIGAPPGTDGLRMVVAFSVADGRITGVFDQLNPAKLSRVPKIGPGAGGPPWSSPADGVAADRGAG